ncbi:TM2 domain-containing protein [Cohnella hashimotonis]|uniref:TM2 domain-containing protein n=1 Tax=Cohnella hashimotonis TaxID=2826895 RepID=A0ABT6TQU9_9BACL|nr:TM2 domain-containing protein [Cohnella hashimotonis]MDI4649228.1 TM2 domain-containing protein [Cohnella hashimotonis]
MYCYNDGQPAVGTCTYCGKFYCKDCMVDVKGKFFCREHVNNAFDEARQQAAATHSPNIVINNANNNINRNINTSGGYAYPYKSKGIALLLCLFFGWIGAHRFYVGKAGTGVLYFLTGGFMGIGVVLDLVLIIVGSFRDKAGYPLR